MSVERVTGVDPAIVNLVQALYSASDVGPMGHEAYVDLYLPGATLIMGPTTYMGHEGIRAFREGAWEKISTRKHVCKGIYPSPDDPTREVMLFGTVDFGMKDGSVKLGVEWAGRLVVDADGAGSSPKITFYQVYLTQK